MSKWDTKVSYFDEVTDITFMYRAPVPARPRKTVDLEIKSTLAGRSLCLA